LLPNRQSLTHPPPTHLNILHQGHLSGSGIGRCGRCANDTRSSVISDCLTSRPRNGYSTSELLACLVIVNCGQVVVKCVPRLVSWRSLFPEPKLRRFSQLFFGSPRMVAR
jgi:hypothetical protein